MSCLVDLFEVCPSCGVCHHDRVLALVYADEWFAAAAVTSPVTAPPRFR